MIALFRLAVEEERRAFGLASVKFEHHSHEEKPENPVPKTRDVIKKAIEMVRKAKDEYEPATSEAGTGS